MILLVLSVCRFCYFPRFSLKENRNWNIIIYKYSNIFTLCLAEQSDLLTFHLRSMFWFRNYAHQSWSVWYLVLWLCAFAKGYHYCNVCFKSRQMRLARDLYYLLSYFAIKSATFWLLNTKTLLALILHLKRPKVARFNQSRTI